MGEKEDLEVLKRLKELDEEDEKKRIFPIQYHLRVKIYKKSELIEAVGGSNTTTTTIENQKCESDIMYCLFKRPHIVAPLLYEKFRELALKKNSPDLGQSRVFMDAMTFLSTHSRPHYTIMTFQILLFLCREDEAQEIISTTSGGEKIYKFVNEFNKHIENVFKMSFGESNIKWIVREFVDRAELIYMSI
jgi:hypothetical protein